MSNTEGGLLLTDTFATVDARYVRVTITGAYNYTGEWASILEFRNRATGLYVDCVGGTADGYDQKQ